LTTGGGRIGGTIVNSTSHRKAERQVPRSQADRHELVERIARLLPQDGGSEPFNSGVDLGRDASPTKPVHGLRQPSLGVVARGSKEILWGEDWLSLPRCGRNVGPGRSSPAARANRDEMDPISTSSTRTDSAASPPARSPSIRI
jgi:hypothetical protein